MDDVEKLIRVLHRLVDASHSVVVIEHNLDVIAKTDWCIDMGLEDGDAGDEVVVEGAPEKLAKAVEGVRNRKSFSSIPQINSGAAVPAAINPLSITAPIDKLCHPSSWRYTQWQP